MQALNNSYCYQNETKWIKSGHSKKGCITVNHGHNRRDNSTRQWRRTSIDTNCLCRNEKCKKTKHVLNNELLLVFCAAISKLNEKLGEKMKENDNLKRRLARTVQLKKKLSTRLEDMEETIKTFLQILAYN